MALISGPTVEAAISDPNSELAKLAATEMEPAKLVGEIFFRVLNRPATPREIELGAAELRKLPEEHQQLAARLKQVETLAAAAKQKPIDPKIQQLRDEVQLSARQLEKARITFAQDLAWALINSPAFLFNR
jgi:DNA repair ATPase RecN